MSLPLLGVGWERGRLARLSGAAVAAMETNASRSKRAGRPHSQCKITSVTDSSVRLDDRLFQKCALSFRRPGARLRAACDLKNLRSDFTESRNLVETAVRFFRSHGSLLNDSAHV